MTITIRCSSLPRVEKCPASATEPDIRYHDDTPEARLGSAFHEVIAGWIDAGSPLPADVEFMALRWDVAPGDLGPLCWGGWKLWGQVSNLYPDPQLEVEMQAELPGPPPVLLTGHADVLSVHDGCAWVVDWKTVREDSRDYTAQLKGYAWLALSLAPELEAAHITVVRVRDGWCDRRLFTRAELEAWWARLVESLGERYGPGEHCGYCPRSWGCAAKDQHLGALAVRLLAVDETGRGGMISNIDLGRLHSACRMVEQAATAARALIKAEVAARGGVVPIGNSLALTLKETTRREIVGAAIPGLLAEYGPDVLECCSVGKTDLGRLVRLKADRGLKQVAEKAAMERLEADGYVQTTQSTRIELVTVEPLLEDHANGDGNETAGGRAAGANGEPGGAVAASPGPDQREERGADQHGA